MTRLLAILIGGSISLGSAYLVAQTTASAVSDSFNQSAALIEGAGR